MQAHSRKTADGQPQTEPCKWHWASNHVPIRRRHLPKWEPLLYLQRPVLRTLISECAVYSSFQNIEPPHQTWPLRRHFWGDYQNERDNEALQEPSAAYELVHLGNRWNEAKYDPLLYCRYHNPEADISSGCGLIQKILLPIWDHKD